MILQDWSYSIHSHNWRSKKTVIKLLEWLKGKWLCCFNSYKLGCTSILLMLWKRTSKCKCSTWDWQIRSTWYLLVWQHWLVIFLFFLCESVCHHGRISYWWHLLWRELPQKQLWVFYPVFIYLSVCLYVCGLIFVSGLVFLTLQDTAKRIWRWQLRSKWNVCLQTDLNNHVYWAVRTWRC